MTGVNELAQMFSPERMSGIVNKIGAQVNIGNVILLLSELAGVTIGLVFMWWGVRKVVKAIMSAFRNGKLSL